MMSQLLQNITTIGGFLVAGMVIFMTLFIVFLVRTWRMKREELAHMSALPLDLTETDTQRGDE